MSNIATDDLLDIDEVCAFFGGSKPLHPATIWRGAGTRYPKPVKIGPNTNRWLRSECDAALQKLIEARGAPKAALPAKKLRKTEPRVTA